MANYSIAYDITADTSGFTRSLNDLSSKSKTFFSSLKGGISDFTSGLGSMGSEFKKFGKEGSSAFKEVTEGITDVSEMLSPEGVLASGILDIIGLLQKLGDEFDNLRAKMVQLAGAEGIAGMENSLKNVLGSGVAQSASTIAETLAIVQKSFTVTGDSLEILTKEFADFSHVTGADIPDSVEKVSQAVKKWGMNTRDVSGILEKLTYASQHSNASVSELLNGLTNGQAILSQFGMSMSESIAFLAKLSDNGIKVSTTLWGLRQALSEFSKSGINAANGLQTVTEQIQNAKTQTEALNIAVDVFGTKAGAELVQVLKKGNDEIANFTKELINVNDVIREDEKEMETLTVMVEKMVNSIKSTFSSLGESVNSIVKTMVDTLMTLVDVLSLLKPLFDALKLAIELVLYPIKQLNEFVRKAVDSIKEFIGVQNESKNVAEDTANAYEKERIALENLRTTVKNMTNEARKARVEWLNSRISNIEAWIEELNEQISENEEILKKFGDIVNLTASGGTLDLSKGIPDWETLSGEEYVEAGDKFLEAQKNAENLKAELLRAESILESLVNEQSVYNQVIEETAESDLNVVMDFVSSLGKVYDNLDEQLKRQRISRLEDEKKNAITEAQNRKASDEELLKIEKNYDDQIKEANLDLIDFLNNKRKEDFINQVATAEKTTVEKAKALVEDEENHKAYFDVIKKIDTYYENERKRINEGTVKRVNDITAKEIVVATEYQKKLLQQQIDYNNKMMANDVIRAENEGKTQEEINAIKKEYNDKNIKILEEYYGILKEEAKQGVTDAEELARIETYWDNELAYAKIENAEKVRKVLEKQKQEDYTWQIRLLQLNLEETTRDKDRIEIQAQILDLQRKQALATAEEGDIKRINEYYDRKILALYEGQDKALEAVGEELDENLKKTEKNYTWQQKFLAQNQRGYQLTMDRLVKEAELAGKSEEEIYAIKEEYLRKIEFEQVKQLDLEKEIALAREISPEEAAEIEAWYQGERYLLALETENKIRALRKETNSPDESKSDEINAREEALEAIHELEESWRDKSTTQRISQLEYLRKVELEIAEENGWTQEQIYESQASYIDQITELKRKQLHDERDEAFKNARAIMEENLRTEGLTDAEKEKMADDYNDTILTMEKYFFDKEAELDLRATREKNEYKLKNEKSFWSDVLDFATSTVKSIEGAIGNVLDKTELGKQINSIMSSVKSMADDIFGLLGTIGKNAFETLFPNLYEDIKNFFKNIDTNIQGFIDGLPSWASQILKIAKQVGGKLVSFVTNVGTVVIATFKGMIAVFDIYKKAWGGFMDLLDFDPDEALIGLLELEDKILTFFMFTLPQLPSYFASAIDSIAVLIDTLFDTVDFDSLFDSLAESFSKVLQRLPDIIKKATPKIIKALSALAKGFIKILPDLLKAGSDLIRLLFAELPKFVSDSLPKLISDIVQYIPDLFRSGSQLVLAIVRMLPTLLQNVIDAFIAILQDRETLNQLVTGIVRGITEMATVIINNIVPIVNALIPAFVEIVINLIKELPNMVGQIVSAIGSALWDFLVNLLTGSSGSSSDGNRDFGAHNWDDGYQFGDITKTVVGAVSDAASWLWENTLGRLFADGTQNAPRGLAVVGEAGPELVNFRGGEQVLSNKNTQKLLSESGRGSVTINNSFYNTADTSAYQIMRQLNQQKRELAFSGVL